MVQPETVGPLFISTLDSPNSLGYVTSCPNGISDTLRPLHVRVGIHQQWQASQSRAYVMMGGLMYKVCSTSGCPHLVSSGSLCDECRKAKDKRRTRGRNPYTSKAHRLARARVLARDPRCVCPGDGPDGCGRHHGLCGAPSTIADHWPIERIELVEAGLDPNDPQRMRGLCKRCHDSKTARTKPSGFNNRQNLS